MAENISSTQSVHSAPARPDRQSGPAEIDAACKVDLQCRIAALQTIIAQLLAENQRLRNLLPQIP